MLLLCFFLVLPTILCSVCVQFYCCKVQPTYMWPPCAQGMCCDLQELARLQKLVQLPSIQEAVKDKFSKFDADLNPTHDHEGNQLDTKVLL